MYMNDVVIAQLEKLLNSTTTNKLTVIIGEAQRLLRVNQPAKLCHSPFLTQSVNKNCN